MTFERQMLVASILMLLVASVFFFLHVTDPRVVPGPPPLSAIEEQLDFIQAQSYEGGGLADEDPYPRFGRAPIFSTLIDIPPTATVTPTPPPPDPQLEEAIRNWKIQGILSGVLLMRDTGSNEEWVMDTRDPDGRKKEIRHQNQNMTVYVESIDEMMLEAVFGYDGIRFGKQTQKKGMFDD